MNLDKIIQDIINFENKKENNGYLSVMLSSDSFEKLIKKNLQSAFEKRLTKEEKKQKKKWTAKARDYANEFIKHTKHKDVEAIYNAFTGKSSISSEVIIAMEEILGIHRDEILGPGPYKNKRFDGGKQIERLVSHMNKSEDWESDIKQVIKSFNDLLDSTDPAKSIMPENIKRCLTNYLEEENLSRKS